MRSSYSRHVRFGLTLAALLLAASSSLAMPDLSAGGVRPPTAPMAVNLTGVWKADDGATYYVRHVGAEVWWFGKGQGFANVFHGNAASTSPELITGRWADVPAEQAGASAYGELRLKILSQNRFIQLAGGGGNFSAKVWIREGGSSGNAPGDSGSGNNPGGAAVEDKGVINWDEFPTMFFGLSSDFQQKIGQRFRFTCKPKARPDQFRGGVWGTGPFTYDSAICVAAVYAGVIKADVSADGNASLKPGETGVVVIELRGEMISPFSGGIHNGVTIPKWEGSDSPGSFVFVKP